MPEKGWSVLTVRVHTALKIREMARARGLTVDELLGQILTSPSSKAATDWSTCEYCGTKVKAQNLHEHHQKVHPDKLTVKV
jgi:hypothetical protein